MIRVERQVGLCLAPLPEVGGESVRLWAILLVVDHVPIRSFMTRFLARDGAIVIAEHSRRKVLEAGRKYGGLIDLLIVDDQIAGQDGVSLALEFRSLRPSTPVLLISRCWNSRLEILRQFGMRCLLKPFTEHQLMSAVRELLKRIS